jgi:hypothetical protein
VRKFATDYKALKLPGLNSLINNAGVSRHPYPPSEPQAFLALCIVVLSS